MRELCQCIFEPADLVELRLLPSGRRIYATADKLHDHLDDLRARNAAGDHIYVGANPRKRRGGKAADVALARCLLVDIDHVTVEGAAQRLDASGLPTPTATVNSGHGVHLWWRLREPLTDLRQWTMAQRHLIGLLDADPAIHDAPRIMRLPGFRNHKAPVADCALLDADPQRRYDLANLVPAGDDPQHVAELWLARAMRRATVGQRNETGLWLACQLRDAGVGQPQAEQALCQYATATGDGYTLDEAVATARSAYSRPAREPARPAATVPDDPADDPQIITLTEAELPDISTDVLPAWAAHYADELSRAKEVPAAMATMLMLPTMASCVQRAYIAQIEPAYAEPLCIYAAPALESGERKTAIHGPVVGPLFEFQAKLREQAAADIDAAKAERRLAEQELKALEKRHRDASGQERADLRRQIVEAEQALPTVPSMPQIIVDDFTEAALGVALSQNSETLLVTSDEGGLFDNMAGRHGDTAEIDLFLKGHTGGAHLVNRIGRENLFLRRPLLSVAISPQPAVLATLGRKAGFLGRGLTARFLWALPRSRVGRRELHPADIGVATRHEYKAHIIRLARFGHAREGDPIRLQLHADAYAAWKAFEREIEPRIGTAGDLRQIKPWASKLPGAVARVAAVVHVGEHLEAAAATPISADVMGRAIALGRALIPHSVAAHRLMGGGGFNVAQEVVMAYEAAGWPAEPQTATAWWRPVRRIVGDTARDFEPVAQTLTDHGYLVPIEDGRRGQRWRTNSRLVRQRGIA